METYHYDVNEATSTTASQRKRIKYFIISGILLNIFVLIQVILGNYN